MDTNVLSEVQKLQPPQRLRKSISYYSDNILRTNEYFTYSINEDAKIITSTNGIHSAGIFPTCADPSKYGIGIYLLPLIPLGPAATKC
jgi:hypothetical protein